MLEHKDLHRGLVEVSYKGVVITDETAPLLALEHNRVCAMRLLAWIASLQMNDGKYCFIDMLLSVVCQMFRSSYYFYGGW